MTFQNQTFSTSTRIEEPFVPAYHTRWYSYVLRRLVEIPVALCGLVVAMPIMVAVALWIRLGSPGPVLFFQDRVGKGGKTFKFVKFRTMYVDAKDRFPELYSYTYAPGEDFKFKITDDPRVTPQGDILRKLTLDELPNFWNVLTGDMALIGPRPEVPGMLKNYSPEALRKFSIRPGVTGLAQIRGRGDLTFADTVKFDLEYVDTYSAWLDVRIFFATINAVVLRRGAF
ncbi:MAG: sugar transferase [Paracoccaceae bacterium]